MDTQNGKRRVAIVHDWLPLYGGAERVLEQIINVYPEADIFSLVDDLKASERFFLGGRPVHTSFTQKLPGGKTKYRHYFPLMPLAIEQFDLSSYNLIISSSYAFAKGVITGPDQLHLCYCHSPIRYAWDMQHQYLQEAGLSSGIMSWIVRIALHYVRLWDTRTANGVDSFMTNSKFVARRIAKTYRRPAEVIYPSVDTDFFSLCAQKEDFYVTVSRMVPYKRVGLIVEAFNKMPDKQLVVIGDGPEYARIRKIAGQNVKLLGFLSSDSVRDYMQKARAFIFAAEEDFGIVPIEALACGTPVIAYNRGGSSETLMDRVTGVFFQSQTVDSLVNAVGSFEISKGSFDPLMLRRRAEQFSQERFRNEFQSFVESHWDAFHRSSTAPSSANSTERGN